MPRPLPLAVVLGLLAGAGLGGCYHATDATPPCFVEPPAGTHQSAVYRVSGPGTCGTGGASVTPISVLEGPFAAVIKFRVRGAKPSTTYFVQRAPEVRFGVPLTTVPLHADRICQRAAGLPPWTAADGFTGPAFVTFPLPGVGPKFTLVTDTAGDGAGELDFRLPSPDAHAGEEYDAVMRLVDDETLPTTELHTGCMTLLVK